MNPPARPPAVHYESVVETLPAGRRAVVVRDRDDREVGTLEFQVCHPCRLGYIGNVAVAAHWQGQGIGRHALHLAVTAGAGYTWSTSRQSSAGRRFFATMEDETGTAFPPDGTRCPHMNAHIGWHAAPWRRKVIREPQDEQDRCPETP
ncbi:MULTISPECIES: GNAT family N-acetyltransferase [Streptomyces]|uniref:N-acetyltransferase n=1 Tax=Streptomyces venezuelae TaxID=54571 RepID=A0A5P2BPW1_STRVZ|nr:MULTISPECIES: GNAT family N-acetyltransferase [Streptomyces]NEA01110.1 GNAT family N-acetyltransferase [Streptomyces sp. SID10116]MYY82239.1 N-acetyltransferase [Streptomyces sp. SID335]MYZ14425.1 N-acetyltransferase [Streptomyces sp. SID337]NDZ86076.1 GNAT family N-acetyltransferase [Streptomyces sp. SID10115]NEB46862.1 GNAT family N-acetyltransferase [Streptomyces sp. SID339]